MLFLTSSVTMLAKELTVSITVSLLLLTLQLLTKNCSLRQLHRLLKKIDKTRSIKNDEKLPVSHGQCTAMTTLNSLCSWHSKRARYTFNVMPNCPQDRHCPNDSEPNHKGWSAFAVFYETPFSWVYRGKQGCTAATCLPVANQISCKSH